MQILAYVGIVALGVLAAAIVYCALVPPNFGPASCAHRQDVFTHRDLLKTCVDTRRIISNADYVRATIISADVLLTQSAARRHGVTPAQVLDAVDEYAAHLPKPQAVLNCLPEYTGRLAAEYPVGYRALNDALVRESLKRWRDSHAFKAKA